RAHMQNIVPVVDAALKKAGCTMDSLYAIAFTQSPGLIGSLLVGSPFAKSLAQTLDIPLLAVHHSQAHVLANLIPGPSGTAGDAAVRNVVPAGQPPALPSFPFLCLTVSG